LSDESCDIDPRVDLANDALIETRHSLYP
jgi:hypothetical protein